MRPVGLLLLLATYAFPQAVTNGPSTVNVGQVTVSPSYLYYAKMHYAGTWSAGLTYSSQDVVIFGGVTFISLQTGNLNITPGTDATFWQQIAGAGGGGGGGTPTFTGDCGNGGTTVLTCGSAIARTGVDINTSGQVTATHLAAPLPYNQGGTAAASAAAAFNGMSPMTTIGDMMYYNGGAQRLPIGSATNVLLGGIIPAWGFLNLGTMTTGNLNISAFNSGSGAGAGTFWRGDGVWAAGSCIWPVDVNLTTPPYQVVILGTDHKCGSANFDVIVRSLSGTTYTDTRPDGLLVDSATFNATVSFAGAFVGRILVIGGNVTNGGTSPTGAAGGDLTGTFPNPTLATVNPNVGACGDATHVCQTTFDGKGRATAAAPVLITGSATAWGAITGTLSSQSDLNTALGAKEATANKDAASGYAGLTAGSLLKTAEFPALTGDCTTSAGAVAVTCGTAVVRSNTTNTAGSSMTLDMSAASATAGLKIPVAAGAIPTTDGFIALNSTTHALTTGSNGITIVQAAAATGTNTSTTCTNQFVRVISSVVVPVCNSVVNADITNGTIDLTTKVTGVLPNANITQVSPTFGTSVSLTSGIPQMFGCTGTCTITVPVPAAGAQYCVYNDDNVATVITFSAIGSSARYENTARTAYGTAGTGTFVSGGAVGDKACLVFRDSTHYSTLAFQGTWTAN